MLYGIQKEKHDGEGRVLTAEFKQFYLVGAYVPSSGEMLRRLDYRVNEWDADFMRYIKALEKRKPVILCGDLNVCHHEIDIHDPNNKYKIPGYAPQERANFNEFLKSGFVDTFRYFYPYQQQFTFWSDIAFGSYNSREKNHGWRLDYFVLPKSFMPYAVDSTIHKEY